MYRFLLQKLIKWKEHPKRKPLVLKGARQVGKTYLLEHFGAKNFAKTHYLNFERVKSLRPIFDEDLSPETLLRKISFTLKTPIDRENDLLIFDEIQMCPQALTSLKYFQEEMPNMAICSAGSLLGVYITPVSYPVGKVDHLYMYPMSFEEFLMAIGDNQGYEFLKDLNQEEQIPEVVHQHLFEKLKWYFIVGGLPEAVATFRDHQENLFDAFEQVRKAQEQLIESYLADMAKHAGKQNALHLSRLWRAVPEQLAMTHDGSMSKFKFKGIIPGVSHYSRLVGAIDWLEGAGLIIKVPIANAAKSPLSAFTKENTFKLYLFDCGLLGALSSLQPSVVMDYTYGTYKGYMAENFVAQELVQSGLKKLYSWHERTAEIEFLLISGNDTIPVEVKSGQTTKAKSLSVFSKKYDPPYQIILSSRNTHGPLQAGRNLLPLYLASRLHNLKF